nr:reverse transcriptase domain-containing protein [Tanacetum cinerariifolium]
NKLSLPNLSPTCMTLELGDRLISRPVRVAEDVYVKVGTFHFLFDFVVVDFDANPRVLLILGRSFLKTGRALIDVLEVNSPTIEHVASLVSALGPNLRPSIPYPSRMQDQKLRDKANEQRDKFFQIFKDLNFNISFVDALVLMPKFGPSIKSLLTNKDKLCELVRTQLNEHCSTVLLKKLPEKLGDPDKFLISCDFTGKAKSLALADLGASINLMPLSVWNKLSLPNLSPTCMTLELGDRLIS